MHVFEPRRSVIRLRERLARRLALLSLFGMLGLLGMMCVSAGLAVASFGAALAEIDRGAPLPTLAWVVTALVLVSPAVWALDAILRASPRPEGIRLPRAAAKELFGLIDELAERVGVPAVHDVRITDDINAAVVQRPSLGVVGALRTELLIGLPLVHGLSPAQLGAVLAHEFGHLAAQRAGVCAWGAHLRAWWVRAFDTLLMVLPLRPQWLERHATRFCRDMLRLAHAEEFEADMIAARLVGADLVGQTLIELSRKAHFLSHDYWPRVHALRMDDREFHRPSVSRDGAWVRGGLFLSCRGVRAGSARRRVGRRSVSPVPAQAPACVALHGQRGRCGGAIGGRSLSRRAAAEPGVGL